MKKKIKDLTVKELVKINNLCDRQCSIIECFECRFYNEEKNECNLKSIDYFSINKIDLDQEIEVEEDD